MKAKIKKEPIRKVRNILKVRWREYQCYCNKSSKNRKLDKGGTWRSGNKKDHDRQCMWHSTLNQMLMDCTCRDVR